MIKHPDKMFKFFIVIYSNSNFYLSIGFVSKCIENFLQCNNFICFLIYSFPDNTISL